MKLSKYFLEIFQGKREVSIIKIILFTSLFFVIFDNLKFFQNVLSVYPVTLSNAGFLVSLAVGITSLIVFLLSLVCSKYTTKPLLIILLLISSLTAYFMDTYNVVIDDIMIQNMVETNWAETSDLLSLNLLYYLLFLGILPSVLIYRIKITAFPLKKTAMFKTRDIALSVAFLLVMVFSFSKFYTSFFREHKPLRYYTNPTYYIYSSVKYVNSIFNNRDIIVMPIGLDAQIVEHDEESQDEHTELVIVIVGEAARADHFSLNGYTRETNPKLKDENIINFSQMYSCGTSTSYSVPCMFSMFSQKKFSNRKGDETENILDVLNHTGSIDILWRDNNSDSKGVATRILYENYKTPENNTICYEGECRDEGMLVGLEQFIAEHKGRDILIVLHQMGNHGPAYYKRYPKEFERFTPVCMTNQLEECKNNEIINAYDNAIVYTDYFLSKTIDFLKKYEATHETAMIYLSDHGESLGENGVYLHGLPYVIAPEAQKHIAALIWFGNKMSKDIDIENVRQKKDNTVSHDNLFHTLLGIFEVKTEVYDKNMDILQN
ncbi:MAG: phosphoethanolamine--lipid A transferase [Desulforhopalus sp.]